MATPLLDLLDGLRADHDERAAFTHDPEGYLASHGWSDLDPGELREALGFVRESMPIDVAVTVPDDPADLTAYVAAFGEDEDLDFGADAVPVDDTPLPDVELSIDLEHQHLVADDEAPTVDFGPAEDDLDDLDDEDDDVDDPLDL